MREFRREFIKYIRGFFDFIIHMIAIAQNDPELKKELDELSEERMQNIKDYEQEISKKFSFDDHRHLNESGITLTNDHIEVNSPNMCINTNDNGVIKMENGIILIGNERIKIHHPNKNYSKEKMEYDKRLQDAKIKTLRDSELNKIMATKPKRRISCGPFHPSRLPINVLEQLCKEGRIQT